MHGSNSHKPTTDNTSYTMLKTYSADTEVSINVLVGGAHRHIAFIPRTLGGSSFATDDPMLQEAIEHHRFFGTRITLVHTMDDDRRETPAMVAEPTGQPLNLTFSSISDAKDYCAEHFGISRTRLKSFEQIKAIAEDNGVVIHLK